ncbi:MAG: coenzyme F420-0:L-glutamate ligase, partial [Alphaproteobacteria bacterium]|nr:coenzyme F420-0:L-glutamate ligase [Alphaproteobacteria bacterium]
MGGRLDIFAVEGLPMVRPGDDLAGLIVTALTDMGEALQDGDIVVIAQKIVSKAEGRQVPLSAVTPSAQAVELAEKTAKDPRAVELVLRESTEVVRAIPGVLITRHRLGFVMANAGIDRSNIEGSEDTALLLPEDPDTSARQIRSALEVATGTSLAVIISDSVGRAWR